MKRERLAKEGEPLFLVATDGVRSNPSQTQFYMEVPREIKNSDLLDVWMPPGIRLSPAHPNTKLFGLFLWHVAGCCSREFTFHPMQAYPIGVADPRTSELQIESARQWFAVNPAFERFRDVKATDAVWKVLDDAEGPLLFDFAIEQPAPIFGGDPQLVRRLLPLRLLASEEVAAADKILALYLLSTGGFREVDLCVEYRRAAQEIGRDRRSVRDYVKRLLQRRDFFLRDDSTPGRVVITPNIHRLWLPRQIEELRLVSRSTPGIVTTFLPLRGVDLAQESPTDNPRDGVKSAQGRDDARGNLAQESPTHNSGGGVDLAQGRARKWGTSAQESPTSAEAIERRKAVLAQQIAALNHENSNERRADCEDVITKETSTSNVSALEGEGIGLSPDQQKQAEKMRLLAEAEAHHLRGAHRSVVASHVKLLQGELRKRGDKNPTFDLCLWVCEAVQQGALPWCEVERLLNSSFEYSARVRGNFGALFTAAVERRFVDIGRSWPAAKGGDGR